jgi:hypothetical protein
MRDMIKITDVAPSFQPLNKTIELLKKSGASRKVLDCADCPFTPFIFGDKLMMYIGYRDDIKHALCVPLKMESDIRELEYLKGLPQERAAIPLLLLFALNRGEGFYFDIAPEA